MMPASVPKLFASHPLRVRGLKLKINVIPFQGQGRTPCGCVD